MAHVVGVPKRDPCQKCNLPVFLAERLTVGKKVYHRTCLKCARCNSQLTPGSFYETEVDGEYCCETCPDEEPVLEVETQTVLRNHSPELYDAEVASRPKTVRSSIADRLAFFEHSNKDSSASSSNKLMQKSLSDEEKSKSLKKMNDESSSPYKMNAALSSFMNSTLNDEVDAGDEDKKDVSLTSAQMDTSESLASSSSESDEEEEEEDEEDEVEQKPPELPTTLPPLSKDSDALTLAGQEKQKTLVNQVSENQPITTRAEITLRTPKQDTQNDCTNTKPTDEKSHNIGIESEESLSATSITIKKIADDVNLSKSKSNFVAKDNTEPDEQMRTTIARKIVEAESALPPSEETAIGPVEEEKVEKHEAKEKDEVEEKSGGELKHPKEKPPLRQRPLTLGIKTNCNTDVTAAEDEETTNRLSVVRARLHQFEVIANNKNTNDNISPKNPENSSSVNSNSIKSDSSDTKQTITTQHQAEDESTVDEFSAVQTISSVAEPEELKIKSDEVPRNDQGTKVDVEKVKEEQIDTETMSIEETNFKELDNVNATNPTNQKMVPQSPQKIVAVEVEMDSDEAKQENTKPDEQQPKHIAMEVEKQAETRKEEVKSEVKKKEEPKPFTSPAKVNIELYPEELNPFKSDDDDDDNDDIAPLPVVVTPAKPVTPAPRRSLDTSTASAPSTGKKENKDTSLNPFDSSDDEVEVEKKVKPPRPPPPKISKNPFGSESEEEGDENFNSMSNVTKKIPVPTPRTNVSLSQNPTPEPTPRLGSKQPNHYISPLNNSSDFYGSNSSLGSTPYSLQRNTDVRGSNNSLTSSTGTIRSRKSRKAPAPPPPVKELFPSTETLDSKKSSPSSSNSTTPHQGRKKRPAPAPPKPARLIDPSTVLTVKSDNNNDTGPKNSLSYPLQSDLDKLSDEEKALLEGNRYERKNDQHQNPEDLVETSSNVSVRKLVPLDVSLVSDSEEPIKLQEEDNVVYRRTIVPAHIVTPTHEDSVSHDRQLEKMKDNKEAQNRNRQSQVSSGAEDADPLYNKSSHGKWKRRKGPAPALPIPPRKVLQMLPLQEIRHELDIIEVQQQGLEKQGVILEKMIRDRCEGKNGELDTVVDGNAGTAGHPQNSKEVEDLILQLFELVNEKNELFRRQAELMYLRRQHRLEQEQADLEYEIRVLMAQPERNKTDTDKAREEALIARMVEVVQLRNEVVECLEMDRLREAEEDLSIKQRLELHSAKREQEMNRHTLSKLSKKEKKKQKEIKKLGKSKKLDADKDADESELSMEKQKSKKKKKKFLF